MRRDEGFTLIELIVAMAIGAVLLTLSGAALRTYWFVQALDGATDETVTQLRELQEDAVSQSFPLVFGARFVSGATSWDLVSYNPSGGAEGPGDNPPGRCALESVPFDSGMFNAGIEIALSSVTNVETADEYSACVAEIDIDSGDDVIWFYARGTSTGGCVVIEHPVSGRQEAIEVGVATGRVTRDEVTCP